MKRKCIITILLLIVVLTFALSGCDLFPNEKSNKSENPPTSNIIEYDFDVYYPNSDNYINYSYTFNGAESFANTRYSLHCDELLKYNFFGFYTEKNGQGERVTDDNKQLLQSFCEAHPKGGSFRAYPKVTPKNYTLTLMVDGVKYKTENHISTDQYPLPRITKTGYYFAGWSTNQGNWMGVTDVEYLYEDTTYYAIFRKQEYTLSYKYGYIKNNTLSFSDKSKKVEFEEEYTLDFATLSGYYFQGYYTQENGQGARLTDNKGKCLQNYGTAENITAYPYYTTAQICSISVQNDGIVNYFVVKYMNYDGTYATSPAYYRNGETISPITPSKTKANYYFAGWSTKDGGTSPYDFKAHNEISQDITFYPIWLSLDNATTTITSCGSRSVGLHFARPIEESILCDYEGQITIKYWQEADPSRSGVNTSNLEVNINGQICDIEENDTTVKTIIMNVTKDQILMIYARNCANGICPYFNYSISYEKDSSPSNTKIVIPTTFTYEVTKGNDYTLPVKNVAGKTFIGYFTRANGLGTQLTDKNGKSLSPWTSGDATIYAYYS